MTTTRKSYLNQMKREKSNSALTKAIQKKSGSEYISNPILKMVPPKAKAKEAATPTVPAKPRMRQYGDKGYKPATGAGTSH